MSVRTLAFAAACAAAVLLASGVGAQTVPQPLLARGEYLVNAVMACDGCHTPRGPDGSFVMNLRFSGGSQTWDTPAYTVKGSNITPDRDTGIGAWSDSEVKRAIVDGVHRHGRPLSPQMPFPFYQVLTARDLDAVVAYLRSLPPVRNEVASPVYRAAMHVETVPGGTRPYTEDMLADPVRRGYYLATIAHCMECHARSRDGTQDYRNAWGRGGFVFTGPYGSAVASNITSHPVAGIGAWSDAEVKRALTHGVGRDGRTFKQPMARRDFFSRMTAADLDAIVAWLRTLPPLE